MCSNHRLILGALAIICIPLLALTHQSKPALPKSVAAVTLPAPEEEKPTHVVFNSVSAKDAVVEEVNPESHQAVIDARKDICIGAMIWGEARGEPLPDRYLAGYVGHMRAVDGWFNSHDPCFQVCKKGKGTHREFDGTKQFCAQIESAFKRGGRLPTVPEEFINIAHEVRTGIFQPRPECRNIRFFANFAESSPGGIKDFQKNTKIRCVGEGDHLFAESRPNVRKMIAKAKYRQKAKPALEALASVTKPQHKKLAAR